MKEVSVIVDAETGVNYLFVVHGYAGGLTPLLDKNGKPIITPPNEIIDWRQLRVKKVPLKSQNLITELSRDRGIEGLYSKNFMELPPIEKRRNHKPDKIVFPKEVEKNEKKR